MLVALLSCPGFHLTKWSFPSLILPLPQKCPAHLLGMLRRVLQAWVGLPMPMGKGRLPPAEPASCFPQVRREWFSTWVLLSTCTARHAR